MLVRKRIPQEMFRKEITPRRLAYITEENGTEISGAQEKTNTNEKYVDYYGGGNRLIIPISKENIKK